MTYRAKGWLFALTFSISAWTAIGIMASQIVSKHEPLLVSSNEQPEIR